MKYLYIILIALFLASCSVFQTEENSETKVDETSDDTEEVYVFDDVDSNKDKSEEIKSIENELNSAVDDEEDDVFEEQQYQNSNKLEEPVKNPKPTPNEIKQSSSFYLQLGAFSSLKRAEQYAEEVRTDVPFKLEIIYKPQTSFYTVRSISYSSRTVVEEIKNDLWSKNLFKDAFIVTE